MSTVLRASCRPLLRTAAANTPLAGCSVAISSSIIEHRGHAASRASSSRKFAVSATSCAQAVAPSTSTSAPAPSSSSSSKAGTSSIENVEASSTSPARGSVESMSPFQQKVVKRIAGMLGYSSNQALAVRVTADIYDRCSERDEREGLFFYDECGLPKSYQSWMSITNLHIWLISVRLRSLPPAYAKTFIQELVNHYFLHSETLMHGRYKVRQGRLIKGYLRDMLYQYHGSNMGYDEGLISGNDAILAAAVWRNLFGAGWGEVAGVKGARAPRGRAPETSESASSEASDSIAGLSLDPEHLPTPITSIDSGVEGGLHAGGSGLVPQLPLNVPQGSPSESVELTDARFALNLERIVHFIRKEVNRMQNISDEQLLYSRHIDARSGAVVTGSLTDFTRI